MNRISLAISSIQTRVSHALLCVIAVAAGVAVLSAGFLIWRGVEAGLARNAGGIDLIVGPQGSPLQLTLSALYHLDIPAGNIDDSALPRLQSHPQVRQAIPLAMGDHYRGHRVVGTTADYIALYHGRIAEGAMFEGNFQAVAGAMTGLRPGDRFIAEHGFGDGGHSHDEHDFTVSGVLAPTGTVLDRLILTSIASVQDVHHHGHHHHDEKKEITAILLRLNSPTAVYNLPRQIAREDGALMAANPSLEMARLSRTLGFSRHLVFALGAGLVAVSGLMLFSALASGLAARRYDLGVIRVLGASPGWVFASVMAEGVILGLCGAVLGVLAGHGLAFAIASGFEAVGGLVLPVQLLIPVAADLFWVALGGLVGALAGLVPAISGSRSDITLLLARRA